MAMSAFQTAVLHWMRRSFPAGFGMDPAERNNRFLEEALELVQACDMTAEDAHRLVDYVFGRPKGIPESEAGGVMVTLAALCLARQMDMADCAYIELGRVDTPAMIARIRAKYDSRPSDSPLPGTA
jgi:hypothetical protein